MAYRLTGTDPFVRFSIGAFNGYSMESDVMSAAALLKRRSATAWHGIHVVDDGTTSPYTYIDEFNPSDQLVGGPDGVTTSVQTFNDTTNWMIVGFTKAAGTGAGIAWTWRWKIGAGAWSSEADTYSGRTSSAGSGYRHIIGNEPALGDDADFDIVCAGLIKSQLSQASFESLDMSSFSTWTSVFTGAGAWLIGFQAIGSLSDNTGNGGNELSRSAGITVVSDPPGWSWGADPLAKSGLGIIGP